MKTKKELVSYLKTLGWSSKQMLGGGYLYFRLPDRRVLIDPSIRLLPNCYSLELSEAVTTDAFNDAVSLALGKKPTSDYILYTAKPGTRIKKTTFSEADIDDYQRIIIEWARSIDLQDALVSHTKWDNDVAPLLAVYKLVALIKTGSRDKLEHLLENLQNGNNNGYPPIIDEALVKRLLEIQDAK